MRGRMIRRPAARRAALGSCRGIDVMRLLEGINDDLEEVKGLFILLGERPLRAFLPDDRPEPARLVLRTALAAAVRAAT